LLRPEGVGDHNSGKIWQPMDAAVRLRQATAARKTPARLAKDADAASTNTNPPICGRKIDDGKHHTSTGAGLWSRGFLVIARFFQ